MIGGSWLAAVRWVLLSVRDLFSCLCVLWIDLEYKRSVQGFVKYLSALKCADLVCFITFLSSPHFYLMYLVYFIECSCVHKFGHAPFRSPNIGTY